MASSSPLSYQTTMPEYPDVSYQAWQNTVQQKTGYGSGWNGSRLGYSLNAWASGLPDYNTWRTNLLDDYNAKMSAYNTWLSSGAGQRASAESGNYNPSYFNNGSPSASPLSYQEGVAPSSGLSEMAQGVSGIFQFIQAIYGMRMTAAQVAGQLARNKSIELENTQKEIQNKYLSTFLQYRNDKLGYQSDALGMDMEGRVFKRWQGQKFPGDLITPFGRMTYNVDPTNVNSFEYQRAFRQNQFISMANTLRHHQIDLLKASKREKDWFFEKVFPIQKKILEHTEGLTKGSLDFQKTEQDLRKAGVIAGISVNVINAAVNAIKAFMPGAGGIYDALSGMTPGSNSSSTWSPGLDFSTGNFYGAY